MVKKKTEQSKKVPVTPLTKRRRKKPTIENVPIDIFKQILLLIPISDMLKNCKASKKFNSICKSSEFWRLRFQQDFPYILEKIDVENTTSWEWKKEYMKIFKAQEKHKNPDYIIMDLGDRRVYHSKMEEQSDSSRYVVKNPKRNGSSSLIATNMTLLEILMKFGNLSIIKLK